MAFNFPNTPTIGDIYGRYKWDGEKWVLASGGRSVAGPPYNFPSSPTENQVYLDYKYDGEKWILLYGGVPKPPVLWTPAQLSTLKLWLKGDSNLGSDGSPIVTWADSSGQANDATGRSATGGGVPAIAQDYLNNLNVVRINEAKQNYFTLPSFLTGFTAGSVIWVARLVADTPAGSAGGVTKFGSDVSSTGNNHYPYTDGTFYDDFGGTTRRSLGTRPGNFTNWHMTSMHSALNDFRVYINGTSFYTTLSNTVAWAPSPQISRGMRLGGGTANAENFIDGWIAELIFVNEGLTTPNRQRLEGYLANKWALQSVLPVGHPYRSTPPLPGMPAYATLDGVATETTLSNGDRTATHNTANTNAGARSTLNLSTGKYYFEATVTNTTFVGGDVIGILQRTATYTNLVTNNSNCCTANASGSIFCNNAVVGGFGIGTCVPGDIISVAVDFGAAKIWFRRNTGVWNVSGGDPVAGVSGGTIATPAAGYAPAVGFAAGTAGNNVTMNFGASGFNYSPPAGYSGWSS